MLLPALMEQIALLPLHVAQLRVLVGNLPAFCLHGLALCTLVVGILTHETQTAIHLVEVLGREDEHQLVLHGAMARHVAHGLYVFVLPVFQLGLQRVELGVENANVAIDMVYVLLNVVDVVLALVYLAVDHHQLIELLADVLAVFLQGFLLFLDFPLDVGPLALQLLYRRVGICHRGAFFRLGVAGLCLLGRAVHLRRAVGLSCRRPLPCLGEGLRRRHDKGEQYINDVPKTKILHLHAE